MFFASSKLSFRKSFRSTSKLWRLLIIIFLVAGIALRFTHLEGKVFQYDEAISLLRVAGYTEPAAIEQLAQAGLITTQDLKKYQRPDPETGLAGTIHGLAVEEAQQTPLYFVLLRFWTEGVGNSVKTVRTLSVLCSLLALPCMYWLCLELFRSTLAGWLGAALLAVSPFQLLYAQEARPNGLWAVTILLSSATLLRALRLQTRASWLVYSATTALSFYTYLFSGFVAIAHVLYILGVERFRLSQRLLDFARALSLSLLAFSPWIVVILSTTKQISSATDWTTRISLSVLDVCRHWLFYLSSGFVDVGGIGTQTPPQILSYFFSASYWLARLLILYGLYQLYRRTPVWVWLHVLTLICVPALCLILPDLILGGGRFTIARYMVPVFLGCQLAVAYVLSDRLLAASPKDQVRKLLWQGLTLVLLTAGILSCGLIVQSETWWSKPLSNSNPEMAQIINQSERPLVVSDAALGDLLSISHYLEPKVRLLVRPYGCPGCQIDPDYRKLESVPFLPPIPSGYSDVFLFHPRPRPDWMERLKQSNYQLTVLWSENDEWLWQITLPPNRKPS